ncbi:NmrA family NAD(P)-binding protein [Actinomadura fibrosa]|uniref:NAD(P)H-binding protein n=1 Tax=Actinomadura fibrosa TaxID=111802 RepID=A0ABW2XKE2_9ACTN|nr:NAD(P)H-binding protein [Actinomadura fibrosa]
MTTLILSGTGKTGRRIAHRLHAADRPARAASRSGDTPLDLDDPTTWKAALDGVTAAYIVEPDLAAGTRIPAFVAEAVAAGARRLVLLSAPAAGLDDTHPLAPAEQAVRDSGAAWTILRPTWFAQNFSEAFWLPGIRAGTLALPVGDGRVPFIDAEDIADVAASALLTDRHAGQSYELTGPRALTFGEAVDLIAKATGRTIRYDDVSPETYIDRQVANGVPLDVARLLTDILVDIRNGGLGTAVTDDVQRALGRPAKPFEDFVAEAAAAGAWT